MGQSAVCDGTKSDAAVERHPACPYCTGSSSLLVSSTDYNRSTTNDCFDYFQCAACGLVFMDPIPENMGPYYAGGYDRIPSSLAELRAIAVKETYRLEPILRHKRGGKLLEIGPWRGVFSCNAKDAGFEVTAIEQDTECVRFLREIVGIHTVQSTDPAETLWQMEESFDVIVLWHSLEHLPHPWKIVETAARRLNPGGLLLVAIPNIDSFEFSFLKDRWRHLDAPRHLFFYPVRSLIALCEGSGFRPVEMTTNDPLGRLLAEDTWRTWAFNLFPHMRTIAPLVQIMYHWAHWKERGMAYGGPGLTSVFQLT